MSQKRHIALGPGAASLILILVTLAMCILSTLTLFTARNEHKLSLRSLEVAEKNYGLYDRSERTLAQLTALVNGAADWQNSLPEGVLYENNALSWRESDGERTLFCTVLLVPDDNMIRLQWQTHRLSGETEQVWD